MGDLSRVIAGLPAEQRSIWAKCFHPSGMFEEFKKEEVAQAVSDRFEQRALRYHDRLAVKTVNQELTYDALNKAANRIAHAILAKQKGAAEPIALLFEQGPQVIAAILGVLKAAKIFVQLDPSYPPERTRYMLGDSQANFIVTNSHNLSLARDLAEKQFQLLNVDELDSDLPTENLALPMPPDTVACLLLYLRLNGAAKGGDTKSSQPAS